MREIKKTKKHTHTENLLLPNTENDMKWKWNLNVSKINEINSRAEA